MRRHRVVRVKWHVLEETLDRLSREGWDLLTCVYGGGYGDSYTLVFSQEKSGEAL